MRPDPLSEAASRRHELTRSRAIQALVATYAAGKAIVDEQAARAAVTEITDT